MSSGQITAELFSMIALITVTTMTLTPFVSRDKVAWSLMACHPRYRSCILKHEQLRDHAVLLDMAGRGRAPSVHSKTIKSQWW